MSETTPETVRKIRLARRLAGSLTLPGDKSISHRYAMLGAIAEGTTEIYGFASSADCQSTLACLRALGVHIERRDNHVVIRGKGLHGLSSPAGSLDAGNSGSTMRMLAGILAGQAFKSRLIGDASLSRRPMKRIIDPLVQMGARIKSAEGGLPPLEIEGSRLSPIRYESPVASAQVKTAVLLAGLLADGETEVREAVATRDHTEIALEQMGASITRKNGRVSVRGPARLNPLRATVPGDISSAAFFLAAAMMAPGSSIVIQDVGLNPTRSAMLDLLLEIGGRVKRKAVRSVNGEATGNIEAGYSLLEGGTIPQEMIPGLIDELPVLTVLGTQTQQGLTFHGAGELRVKESDRLAAVAENLRRMGAQVEEFSDGLHVPGRQRLHGAEIETYGDHRIAMAFAVAGLVAEGGVTLRESECVAISFPEFFDMLDQVTEPA